MKEEKTSVNVCLKVPLSPKFGVSAQSLQIKFLSLLGITTPCKYKATRAKVVVPQIHIWTTSSDLMIVEQKVIQLCAQGLGLGLGCGNRRYMSPD